MAQRNDGTAVTQMGNTIHASDGVYTLTGTTLVGPGGFCSTNVENISEAVGIVIGLHGGKLF